MRKKKAFSNSRSIFFFIMELAHYDEFDVPPVDTFIIIQTHRRKMIYEILEVLKKVVKVSKK